jgi:hypothetical protein
LGGNKWRIRHIEQVQRRNAVDQQPHLVFRVFHGKRGAGPQECIPRGYFVGSLIDIRAIKDVDSFLIAITEQLLLPLPVKIGTNHAVAAADIQIKT